MSATRLRRLRTLTTTIGAMPFAPEAVQRAFEAFCVSGQLPGEERFATAVVERVRQATAQEAPRLDYASRVRSFARLIDQIEAGELPPAHEDLRETLFQEAQCGVEFVRVAARAALRQLVAQEADLGAFQRLADMPAPEFGTVGLCLVGLVAGLGNAGDEERAQGLRQRFAALRRQVHQYDAAWFVGLAAAGVLFRSSGTLPEEPVLREAVLANAELLTMLARAHGDEVADALRTAIEAGDVAANQGMFCRLHYTRHRQEEGDGGPPVPKGQALIVWARQCADAWMDNLSRMGLESERP